MAFIGTISHSLACQKRRAPLDSQPIATGSVWLRAANMRLASERKSWLRGRGQQLYKSGSSCWSYWHEENFSDMTFELRRSITADHPSLPGHFPDAPLVPGVLILDEVLAALRDWRKDCQLAAIRTVKFLQPLKPEQAFTICLSTSNDDATGVNFCCRIEGQVIVEGQIEIYFGTKVTS
jgi:3-hydroxyacyl-[acyl-carrier-protein] dehydratase